MDKSRLISNDQGPGRLTSIPGVGLEPYRPPRQTGARLLCLGCGPPGARPDRPTDPIGKVNPPADPRSGCTCRLPAPSKLLIIFNGLSRSREDLDPVDSLQGMSTNIASRFLILAVALAGGGCATCAQHPVACTVGAALVAGTAAEMAAAHGHREASEHPIHTPHCPGICR